MLGPHSQEPPPLTTDDWKKIEKSMKKPEFMGLLSQYMVEISDPKNRKEYDDYLRQMEIDGELPKHMKLIKPTPAFCVKTALVSQTNKSQEMKFFMNMCSAEEVEKPSFELVNNGSGKVGQSWKIPNSMGKIRYDQDKNGNICQTVDAVFNPEVYVLSRHKEYQAMVINIAIETAQRQLGERKQTISKDYKVLENVKCKGEEPALLVVRSIDGKLMNKGEGGEVQRDRDGKQTKLQKQINDKKKDFQQQKEKQEKQQGNKITEEDLSETPAIQQEHKGPQRPQFHTIYSYPVQYMDFLESGAQRKKIPTALNIEFKVPLIQQFKQIKSLDINEKKILLDAGEKYFIDLQLEELKIKYQLVYSESKAKFDKKKKTLRITIPVDKTSIAQAEAAQIESLKSQPDQEGEETNQLLDQIVEQKTWQDKNKLLEITAENVGICTLNEPETERKPERKFVEQIDEDDVQAVETKVVEVIEPKTMIQEPIFLTPQPLTFRLQQNPQKVFLILHLPKYKKQQVTFLLSQNKIYLECKTPKLHKYLTVNISVNQSDIQVVYVVDFVVINIGKHDDQQIVVETATGDYETFKEQLEALKVLEKEKEKQQIREKQNKETEIVESKAEFIEHDNTAIQTIKEPTFNKSTTNPQFIPFKISIVDEID